MKISRFNFDTFKIGIIYTNEYFKGFVFYLGYKRIIFEFKKINNGKRPTN